MRCKEFDAHVDEMLSGVLHPDADQHMRQCERCTSYYRARTVVQNGLRAMAAALEVGPSRATDRAVMDSYRRLQERKAAAAMQPSSSVRPAARLFTFPSRGPAARGTRVPWGGVAVAAMLLAVAGSSIRLWHGLSTVSAPSVATANAVSGPANSPAVALASLSPGMGSSTGMNTSRHALLRQVRLGAGRSNSAVHSASPEAPAEAGPVLAKAVGKGAAGDSAMRQTADASSIMHLASTAGGDAGQSASSTWPGYSNLMYCDPVVCSGPMQVVHIKVPMDQVNPNVGQTEGKSFVNADVVVGADGVARAIRVAN